MTTTMRRCGGLTMSLVVACSMLGAQADRFEVASVKANTSATRANRGIEVLPGGVVRATNVPLWLLIQSAYDITARQVDGPPLLDERFDINAKAGVNALPEDAPARARSHQVDMILQALLAERFKMVVHTEKRDSPLYALIVAKGGPRLKPSTCKDPASCARGGGGPAGGFRAQGMEIANLVSVLNAFLDRHVVDRTGIQGRYDFELPPWNPGVGPPSGGVRDGSEPAPSVAEASIFTVLQEQLGLRLEATRGPLDYYIVDHVERPTAD